MNELYIVLRILFYIVFVIVGYAFLCYRQQQYYVKRFGKYIGKRMDEVDRDPFLIDPSEKTLRERGEKVRARAILRKQRQKEKERDNLVAMRATRKR